MSFKDPYLFNSSSDVHLRDARHAHQLYTEHNFALAPKTKFLYHVVFDLTGEASGNAGNTDLHKKEIGVLVKQADLPGYRVSVENKQQYNRKKDMQTRIDYQDVTIQFHDDNLGLTRGLLEDYYMYYYVDGNHRDQGGFFSSFFGSQNAYNARDKYDTLVPNYGLNNDKYNPFFRNIRIYQLARRQWFAYTLINPLITQFDHGDVESADGSGFNANSISVAYESVIYSNGSVGEGGQPIGFTDDETRYDNVMSPLTYGDPGFSSGFDALPKLFDRFLNKGMGSILPRTSNPDSRSNSILRNENGALGMIGAGLRDLFSVPQPGGLAGSRIPTIERRQREDRSTLERRRGRILDVDTIRNTFEINTGAKRSFVTRSLNSNAIPGQTVSTYRASAVPAKTAIEDELVTRATNGDVKLQRIATDAIDATRGISI